MKRTALSLAVAGVVGTIGCASDVAESPESTTQEARIATWDTLQCQTTREIMGDIHEFSLEVRALRDSAHVDLAWDEDDYDVMPMTAEPNLLLTGMIENYDIQSDDTAFRLHGDSDGIQYTDLVLYKNSGYTKGYVRVTDGGGYFEKPSYYSTVNCTVTGKRPKLVLGDANLLGTYSGADSCYGQFDACITATMQKDETGKMKLVFGDPVWGGYEAELEQRGNLLRFSTGDRYAMDGPDYDACDDEGCGNMLDIHGFIYPKKVEGGWAPTIVAWHTIEVPWPGDEGTPAETHRGISRMTQDDTQ